MKSGSGSSFNERRDQELIQRDRILNAANGIRIYNPYTFLGV